MAKIIDIREKVENDKYTLERNGKIRLKTDKLTEKYMNDKSLMKSRIDCEFDILRRSRLDALAV